MIGSERTPRAHGIDDDCDGVHPVQWEVARVTAGDGVHDLTGSAPFGIVIVGYDAYDSYAYPGGLDQQIINPIN